MRARAAISRITSTLGELFDEEDLYQAITPTCRDLIPDRARDVAAKADGALAAIHHQTGFLPECVTSLVGCAYHHWLGHRPNTLTPEGATRVIFAMRDLGVDTTGLDSWPEEIGQRYDASQLVKMVTAAGPPQVESDDDRRARIFDSLSPASLVLASKARTHFVAGHFEEAVLAACKALAEETRRRTSLSDDGKSLMQAAFTKTGQPPTALIPINALSDPTDLSQQEGVMFLAMGVFSALRNVAAHKNHRFDEHLALESIATVSLVCRHLP